MAGIGYSVFLITPSLVSSPVNLENRTPSDLKDKSNIQEVASGGDEGCGTATSLIMTIAATIIGQHPPNHNMSDAYRPSGWRCRSGALCVGK